MRPSEVTGRVTTSRKPRRRRKNGRYLPDPLACTIPECASPVLSRGMCRKHYDRWRKWGDPLIVGRVGGPKFAPEALEIAGITQRQRNHWAASGLLGIEQDPVTGRYLWDDTATAIAILIKRLLEAGLALDVAGAVAQGTVREGKAEVEIGDGIRVRVNYEHQAPL